MGVAWVARRKGAPLSYGRCRYPRLSPCWTGELRHSLCLQGALWVCLRTAMSVNIKAQLKGTSGTTVESCLFPLLFCTSSSSPGCGGGSSRPGAGEGRKQTRWERSRTLDQAGWSCDHSLPLLDHKPVSRRLCLLGWRNCLDHFFLFAVIHLL